jgi:hypothetical protein
MGCGEAGGKITPIQPADLVSASPISAFGERLTAPLTPEIQLTFTYNIDAEHTHSHSTGTGAVTQSASHADLQTGASANSLATLRSKRLLKYNTGQGGLCRFTAIYTPGVAGSEQVVGLGNESDGFFFGYNGTAFGILHRRGGALAYHTLTVSTKSSNAENITITLDGTAVTDVAVTNGADATVTANEIAAHDYSDTNGGWDAVAYGDTVVFTSHDTEAKAGAFTLSGATSAVGTFATTVAGVASTDNWIAQADWNEDNMLGSGLSGQTLDTTKGNVYQIRYQWLGYGMIRFYIEDAATGAFQEVHKIAYANANTQVSLINPTLPVFAGVLNTTNDTNITLRTPSWMAAVEGLIVQTGDNHGATGTKTLADATETPILSITNDLTYGSVENRIPVELSLISAAVEHTKAVTINLYRNVTLVGASWTIVHADSSPIRYDTSATSFTGGDLMFSMSLGRTGNQVIQLNREDLALLLPGDTITATADPTASNNAEVVVSFNWIERH